MWKLTSKIFTYFFIGFATFYSFLSLIGYWAAFITDSILFRLYFKNLMGVVHSVTLKKILLYIFWLPAEALIVVITITAFSYFIVDPSFETVV